MNETVKIWLEGLYESEIRETKVAIENEYTWELGYDGKEPNPHSENIKQLKEYLEILEEKLKEIK